MRLLRDKQPVKCWQPFSLRVGAQGCYVMYILKQICEGYASRGKTSKGWFYGFKLHGACDTEGNLVNLRFTTGSEHDSQQAEPLTGGLSGIFVGDAGYLLRQEVFTRLFETHKRILSAARKNMKRLMTEDQGHLLRKRSIIETV